MRSRQANASSVRDRPLLIFHRRQNKFHLTQICHRVTENEREIVLEIEFDARAEARALRKENEVLQLEEPLYNLR